MGKASPYPLALLLTLLALISCGQGQPVLVSITITPSTATVSYSSTGTGQFTASGTYSDGSVVTPLKALWFIETVPWVKVPIPGGVTVNNDGLAQCKTFVGSLPILAIAPKFQTLPLDSIYQTDTNHQHVNAVIGKAELTCVAK